MAGNITTVPSGWRYYDNSVGTFINAGGAIPTPANGDELQYVNGGNLGYNFHDSYNLNTIVLTNCFVANVTYSNPLVDVDMLDAIRGVPVSGVSLISSVNTSIKTISHFPSNVISIRVKLGGLTTINEFPSTVKAIDFRDCPNLVNVPAFPSSLERMYEAFDNCTSLVAVPEIPELVYDMEMAFYNCSKLEKVPNIPSSVTNAWGVFRNCTKLKGLIRVDCRILDSSLYNKFFDGTSDKIYLYGKGNIVDFAKTSVNNNVKPIFPRRGIKRCI